MDHIQDFKSVLDFLFLSILNIGQSNYSDEAVLLRSDRPTLLVAQQVSQQIHNKSNQWSLIGCDRSSTASSL